MAYTFFNLGIDQGCKHALQTCTHLLAVFLDHHVQAEWVSAIRQPCLMQCAACDSRCQRVFPTAGDSPFLGGASLSLPWLPSVSSRSPRDPTETGCEKLEVKTYTTPVCIKECEIYKMKKNKIKLIHFFMGSCSWGTNGNQLLRRLVN